MAEHRVTADTTRTHPALAGYRSDLAARLGGTADTICTDPALAAYRSDLAARLRGPHRRRAAILAELSDGLARATEDQITAGLPPELAARAAIARFGTPQSVADAFGGELATAYARRTIAAFVVTGPLVGIWWLLLLHPRPWRTGPTALVAAIPVIPLVVVAVIGAGAILATTGRLMRWLPETGPRRALAATTAIAGSCLIADLTMIASYLLSGLPGRPLAAIAIAVSLTRVTAGVVAMRHATRMRVINSRHPDAGDRPM